MFLFEILVFKLGYLSGIFSEGIKHICHFKENKCHFKENNYYFLLIIRLDLHKWRSESENLYPLLWTWYSQQQQWCCFCFQFSCLVVSDSLRPHESQHARPPCPSPTPGVHPNPCPLSRWCHPSISSSVVPFSSRPQSFPASGSFHMSQLFASGGPKYWSFSFNISPSNEHPGVISFRMHWLLDLLAIQGTLKTLLQHYSSKASILQCSVSL